MTDTRAWDRPWLRRSYLLAVPCDYCKAKANDPCVTKSGATVGATFRWHSARYAGAGHPMYGKARQKNDG